MMEPAVTRPDRADFLKHVTAELLICCQRNEVDNIDRERFGYSSSTKAAIRNKVRECAAYLGFYRASAIPHDKLREGLGVDGLDDAYGLLEAQLSLTVFITILAD